MKLDWTIPIGTFLIIGAGILTNLGATFIFLVRTAFALQKDFEARFNDVKMSISSLGNSINRDTDGIKNDLRLYMQKSDAELTGVRDRLTKIESGQDAWTRTLRARTHATRNNLNKIVLAIELLRLGRNEEVRALDLSDPSEHANGDD